MAVKGGGGAGAGGLIRWTLWITPVAGLCSRWSSALGTRNCHLSPMSATPSAVRAPQPGGRRPPASDHPVPSAVAPRWRTRPLVDHPLRHEAVRQLVQVDRFVLQGPPQPLDEHRLMNTLSGQRPRPSIEQRTPAACSSPREHDTGERAALIGVEDLRRSVALRTPGDGMSWLVSVAAVDRHARRSCPVVVDR